MSDPNLASILLATGGLGIYAELSSPGMILPGVVGSVLAMLGIAGFSGLPIGWLGGTLVILAVAFFALEMKFTSRGVIAVCGALALVLGALFLIDSPLPEMRIKPLIVFTVVLPFALITAFLVTVASRARRNKIAGARFPQQSAANLQAMDRQ